MLRGVPRQTPNGRSWSSPARSLSARCDDGRARSRCQTPRHPRLGRPVPGTRMHTLPAALRDDPVTIAEQVEHTNPSFTLSVYAKATKRRERLSGSYLAAYDAALVWASFGTGAGTNAAPTVPSDAQAA